MCLNRGFFVNKFKWKGKEFFELFQMNSYKGVRDQIECINSVKTSIIDSLRFRIILRIHVNNRGLEPLKWTLVQEI